MGNRLGQATLTLCVCLAWSAAGAEAFSCRDSAITVHGSTEEMGDVICGAAADALEFLQRYELRPRRTIEIHIVEKTLHHGGYSAYGSYDGHRDRIELMSFQAVLSATDSPTMYREPFDETHYRGAIAHEVAHAVVDHNSRVSPLSKSAQEYLAHATQLAVLPPARRARIIRMAGVGPWEPNDVISDIYMAMAPDRFAVKSYLHLTGHRDPQRFVQILLSSKWFYVYVE